MRSIPKHPYMFLFLVPAGFLLVNVTYGQGFVAYSINVNGIITPKTSLITFQEMYLVSIVTSVAPSTFTRAT